MRKFYVVGLGDSYVESVIGSTPIFTSFKHHAMGFAEEELDGITSLIEDFKIGTVFDVYKVTKEEV